MASPPRSGFGGRGERKPIRLFGEAIGTSAYALRSERASSAALRRCLRPDSDYAAARIGPKIFSGGLRRTEVNFDSLDHGRECLARTSSTSDHPQNRQADTRARSRCLHEACEPDTRFVCRAWLKEVGEIYRSVPRSLRASETARVSRRAAIEILEPASDDAPALLLTTTSGKTAGTVVNWKTCVTDWPVVRSNPWRKVCATRGPARRMIPPRGRMKEMPPLIGDDSPGSKGIVIDAPTISARSEHQW
jgi:hypothetical protein